MERTSGYVETDSGQVVGALDSFAAQNTPDGGNARAEFFRDRRTVPMGPAGWRGLLQQG